MNNYEKPDTVPVTGKADRKSSRARQRKKRGEYKVLFKGRLLDGFSKEQVVANIARLTKISEEKVEKKFFSGKAVIIRRDHDKTHAQKLQQLFTNAGLEVVILTDLAQISNHQSESPGAETKTEKLTRELKKTLQKRKRPMLAIVLWAVLTVISINLWNKYNISVDVPDEIVNFEQSLANESLVFLAHVNFERLISLQNYFVADLDALPGTHSAFYHTLKTSGLEVKKSIQQILSAAYLEDRTLVTHTILLGNFSVPAVKTFFLNHYHGEVIPDADFVRLRIAETDPGNCQKGSFREVSIEPQRILITNDGQLDNLHQLLRKAPGKVTDLSKWAQYRSDKLISIALFKPEQGKHLDSGMTAGMIETMAGKNKPLNSLYAGVGLQLLPPGGLLDVSLNSQSQAWLDKTNAQLSRQVEEMKSSSHGLANLQTLLNKVSIYQDSALNSGQDTGQLSIKLQWDNEVKKSIDLSLREFTDRFFTMDDPSGSKPSDTVAVTEKIALYTEHFLPQYDKSQLKPFNEQFDNFFKPGWIGGPFAVAVDQLLIEKEHIVLQLRGKGHNIENIGNKQSSLIITAVNDAGGKNLLAERECGDTGKNEETFFSRRGAVKNAFVDEAQIAYNELEVSRKVKLRQGIKFSQVKSLLGQVELNLTTETHTEQFARLEQNKVVSVYGSRILFKPSAIDTLSYVLSGDEKRVLAVRALNKKQQYLSRTSTSSSMSNLLASGRSIIEKYQGEIAFIEVVYAKSLELISYPVEISRFPPYPSEDFRTYQLQPAKLSSVADWNSNYDDTLALPITQENDWHEGPFNLALSGLKTSQHWGTSGRITIKTPLIDELQHNLSVLELYFRYPEVTENGAVGKSYYYQLKAEGYYLKGEFIPDVLQPYLQGQFSFVLPYKKEQLPLKEIMGDIIVHLPLSKHSSSYSDMSIGAQWEDEGVSTRIVRLGNGVMEFAVTGNRSRLLQITLLDAKNQRLSTTDIRSGFQEGFQSGLQEQEGNIIVNYKGTPAKALLTVSEGQQTRRYPFLLKLN